MKALAAGRNRVLDIIHLVKVKGPKRICVGVGRLISQRIAFGLEWASGRVTEWRLGISTSRHVSTSDLGYRDQGFHEYTPTTYSTIRKLMRALGPLGPKDVFIDFGSGKGRVLILAGMYPIGSVIGVELSPLLSAVARKNIQRARQRLHCKSIEVITMDVTTYQLPSDATILYFQNPFSGVILDAVLEKIKSSLVAAPRRITMVTNSHTALAEFEQQIRKRSWLKMVQEIDTTGGLKAWLYVNTCWTGR